MFDKEYAFKGSHAEKVNKLTSKYDDEHKIFNRNFDVYRLAPIVGFLYQRKATVNNENGSSTKVFSDILIKNEDELQYIYQLIILLDKKNCPILEQRIDNAFRFYNSEKTNGDRELFNQYVLGGVDVLYEKIIEPSNKPDDYIENLYNFLEELDERYNSKVDYGNIEELCRLARG